MKLLSICSLRQNSKTFVLNAFLTNGISYNKSRICVNFKNFMIHKLLTASVKLKTISEVSST